MDTINEIAGAGDVPHPCVGQAKRTMVPSPVEQGSVMSECVQNHSPEVMVVDKIGHPNDVEAALAAKESGVRLISSMNGDLRKLITNSKLQGLLGVETVVLGQSLSKRTAGITSSVVGGKSVLHRTSTPGFDVVVELCPGTQCHHNWRIILNTADAVDSVLAGGKYQSQHRIRDPVTGEFSLKMGDS